MGAVCGCIRAMAISSPWPQVNRREWVTSQPREPESAETKNGGCEDEEIHEIGALTGACEVLQTLEMAEASSRHDDNKRVMEARRARVKCLQKLQKESASQQEFDTVRSHSVWTQLDSSACSSSCAPYVLSLEELERIRYENRLHFQRLLEQQSEECKGHGTWSELGPWNEGSEPSENISYLFYVDFRGQLKAGQKIGGGAQADIHEAIYHGKAMKWFVLKVFRSEYLLTELQHSWTQCIVFTSMGWTYTKREYNNYCEARHATVLEDGRFAFVLQKCWGDLCKAIDLKIVEDKTHLSPPFPHSIAVGVLLAIAAGMAILHRNGIVHRDLKTANCLLVHDPMDCLPDLKSCLVANFESGGEIAGTKFWRAPEVLLALKNKQRGIYSTEEIWTPKTDVYSYAMTCYEVLTGCIPFEDLATNDYDRVIGGERPPFPDYVNPKLQDLVRRCWQSEPSMRPPFIDIVMELTKTYDGPYMGLLRSLHVS